MVLRITVSKLFSVLTPAWEDQISVEGGDFMGQIRLLVQGQGVDLSRASRILVWILVGVFGWPKRHQQKGRSLGVSLSVSHNSPYQWHNPYFRCVHCVRFEDSMSQNSYCISCAMSRYIFTGTFRIHKVIVLLLKLVITPKDTFSFMFTQPFKI